MKLLSQVAIIGGAALLASAITFRVAGPPVAQVVCNPADLAPDEICLSQVTDTWGTGVLWVDARPRSDWQVDGMKGSILWNTDPREDANRMEEEAMQRLIESPVVIVYCAEGDCGVSREIAKRIRELDVVEHVYALHGGIGALRAAGLTGSN